MKTRRWIAGVVFMFSFLAGLYSMVSCASAADYYVSPKGKDTNKGTLSSPWKTLQKAANTVAPGDTVYVRSGTYKERVTLNKSGEAGKYITFKNYKTEKATIDGSRNNWGYDWDFLFNLNRQSHIKIEGLSIINSRWFGIGSTNEAKIPCQDIIIRNCTIRHTQGAGILISGGSDITIDKNEVEDACYQGRGTAGTQECISVSNIKGFSVTNNHVFNCKNSVPGMGGEMIDIKNGSSDGIVANNRVHGFYKIGIYVDAWDKNQSGISVYDNTIYNSGTYLGKGSGITLAAEEETGNLEDVTIRNNIVYEVETAYCVAAYSLGRVDNLNISNNVSYKATYPMELGDNKANMIIRNNILHANATDMYSVIRGTGSGWNDFPNLTVSNNLYNKDSALGIGNLVGRSNIFVDPDGTKGARNFHLVSSSIANDAGYKGVDMGAY